jgi:valyl-tRNA synthetase
MNPRKEIPKTYNPKDVEGRWAQFWLDRGYFHAEANPAQKPFTIVLPPPNVSGGLHLGHALQDTIHDILIRYHRMSGWNTLWLPGMDHAGISAQNAVERELAREGITRQDLGREEFLKRVWKWKEQYGGLILRQLKMLGCSCDWARERFTMDPVYSRAVREAFVRFYEKKLIYRGARVINWCPRCATAISDIEVEYKDTAGHLWYVRYAFEDGSGGVTIATTRPETMLGDTAVAVNPEDPRYEGLVGKLLVLPILERRIPLIADAYADPEFGSGAVKVTPAHDPNDFEAGQRNRLPSVVAIGPDARMTDQAGKFAGLDRYECRDAVVRELEQRGQLEKVDEYHHAVGACQRCHTVIEPLLSEQWFVRMKGLAEPAIRAVRREEIRFYPPRFAQVYLDWMENIKDWCISRQLWWGHRIPVWTCASCGELIVSREDPRSCPACGSGELSQDPDVLDTWFSSALWPFATLGWPQQTQDLAYFYPTSVLITARDIIHLWVARMIMTGLEFIGKIPFSDVLIHPTIQTAQGRRMSRTLGTGVDPLELMDRFGTDATRFGLILQTGEGQDVRFSEERIETSRNFANKLWNAARFAQMNLGMEPPAIDLRPPIQELADRWILSRYQRVAAVANELIPLYRSNECAKHLFEFFWHEYCDWYLELAKPRLVPPASGTQSGSTARWVMWNVLEGFLRLIHPFMPFVSEEVWQNLPHRGGSLATAPYPGAEAALIDATAERDMGLIQELVTLIRNIRSEMNVSPTQSLAALVRAVSEEVTAILKREAPSIAELARLEGLTVGSTFERPPHSAVALGTVGEIYIPLEGVIDFERERGRLGKELGSVVGDLERIRRKLANQSFLEKARPDVVEKEREREEELSRKKHRIEQNLAALEG